MKFENFLRKQEEVYEKFRKSIVYSEGLKTNRSPVEEGYTIYFRHPKKIRKKVANFSKRISEQVYGLTYNENKVHTTISFNKHNKDYPIPPDKNMISCLLEILTKIEKQLGGCSIIYPGWLCNQSTVIAQGYPDESFFNICKLIIEEAEKKGIQLTFPWGSHISVNRFIERKKLKELKVLFELIKNEPPLGVSRPESIEVGYSSFRLDLGEWSFNSFGGIRLS